MKQWIRRIALLLVLVMCFAAFAACDDGSADTPTPDEQPPVGDGEGNNTPGDSTGDDEDEEEAPELLDPAQAMILVENKKSDYVIVIDDKISFDAKAIVNGFKNSFWIKTGADLKLKKDTDAAQAKEILVYTMNDRREVSDMKKKVTAPGGHGYYIGIEGEKIVVACDELIYLEPALALLTEAVRDCGNGVFGIRQGYEGKLDIPAPVASAASKVQIVYTNEGNYTVNVHNASKKNYTDYCATLGRTLGKYSSNQIGDNQFATYIKDDWSGQMAVYTMYYPNDKCYKVTYGPLSYLPDLLGAPEGTDTVRPSITQNDRDGAEQSLGYSAPGMCHFIQLSDGRFLLFDSGPYNKNDTSSKDDVDELYNLLKSMTPGGKAPVIAGWFFSHAHGDHMAMANAFLDRYNKSVSLQMVGYNFPDDSLLPNEGNFGGMANNIDTFEGKVEKYYPKADKWVCHSGEILQLPGCKLEVIYTPEDFVSDPDLGLDFIDSSVKFPSGNHTCTVFRMTVNKTTFLVLGDAEKTLCEWIGANYKTALKSDILSVSHHGSNGGDLALYQYVNPTICFWPVDSSRFNSHDWQNKYDYNRYLLTGNREHYTASQTKTIYC